MRRSVEFGPGVWPESPLFSFLLFLLIVVVSMILAGALDCRPGRKRAWEDPCLHEKESVVVQIRADGHS